MARAFGCVALALALPADMCERITLRWDHVNPHLRGAGVADILDMLDQGDSDLDLIESFEPGELPDHPSTGLAARALIWGRPMGQLRNLSAGDVAELLTQAGCLA